MKVLRVLTVSERQRNDLRMQTKFGVRFSVMGTCQNTLECFSMLSICNRQILCGSYFSSRVTPVDYTASKIKIGTFT